MNGVIACVAVLTPVGTALGQDWSHFARAPDRASVVMGAAPGLSSQRWIAYHDPTGQAITFVGQSGVVVDSERVYAIGKSSGIDRLYAIGRGDGEVQWMATVVAPFVGSWSSPVIDDANGTVIAGAGAVVWAFDRVTGARRWERGLARQVVNASPLVTDDLGPRDRVLMTDYDPFGTEGRLYGINADAFNALANPWQPGEIVWSVVLGATSGNTPAYATGIVYVPSVTDETGSGPGVIRAYDATATSTPDPLWTFSNLAGHGFFGGVCVHQVAGARFLYAASYAFNGGQTAANLVKVNASDGTLVWSVAANRTAATPIPLGDGRIVLPGGVVGFGSMPSIQLFQETGPSAAMLWDTALDTWTDANGNGVMEVGEFLLVGGWTHQPAAVLSPGSANLLAGAVPTGSWSSACTDLYALDLDAVPADPGFILDHAIGSGSTPAIVSGEVYTIGAGGVAAYGACYADCNEDGALTIGDFGCFQSRFASGNAYADCNASGGLTVADFGCFQTRFAAGCP